MRIVAEFSGDDAGIIIMTPQAGSKERTAHFFFSVNDGVRLVTEHALDDPNAAAVLRDIRTNPMLPVDSPEKPPLLMSATFASSTIAQIVAYAGALSGGAPSIATFHAVGTIIAVETSKDTAFPDAFICWVDPDGVHTFAVFFSQQDVERTVNSLTWVSQRVRTSIIEFMKRGTLPEHSDKPPVLLTGQLAGYLNSIYALRRQNRARAN